MSSVSLDRSSQQHSWWEVDRNTTKQWLVLGTAPQLFHSLRHGDDRNLACLLRFCNGSHSQGRLLPLWWGLHGLVCRCSCLLCVTPGLLSSVNCQPLSTQHSIQLNAILVSYRDLDRTLLPSMEMTRMSLCLHGRARLTTDLRL